MVKVIVFISTHSHWVTTPNWEQFLPYYRLAIGTHSSVSGHFVLSESGAWPETHYNGTRLLFSRCKHSTACGQGWAVLGGSCAEVDKAGPVPVSLLMIVTGVISRFLWDKTWRYHCIHFRVWLHSEKRRELHICHGALSWDHGRSAFARCKLY